jgi:Flp pilus assembly pilin Flp
VYLALSVFFLFDITRSRDQRGQASAEYALVLLGAAAIALLVVAWATKNDMVGKLLDGVMKHILDSIK